MRPLHQPPIPGVLLTSQDWQEQFLPWPIDLQSQNHNYCAKVGGLWVFSPFLTHLFIHSTVLTRWLPG